MWKLAPQIVIGEPQAVMANSGPGAISGAASPVTPTNVSVVTNKSTSDPEYSYKVKIINPNRLSNVTYSLLSK